MKKMLSLSRWQTPSFSDLNLIDHADRVHGTDLRYVPYRTHHLIYLRYKKFDEIQFWGYFRFFFCKNDKFVALPNMNGKDTHLPIVSSNWPGHPHLLLTSWTLALDYLLN